MLPVVGVLPLWDDDRESLWMLPGYFDGIRSAGGLPVMLPLTSAENEIERCVSMCDGFLFTGGQDVSPEIYKESVNQNNVICCKERDDMELRLLKLALELDKPILGICRGIQFINAALGGTLYQDLPSEHPSESEHHQMPPYDMPVHAVTILKESPLYSLLHKDILAVNSYHHQAVKDIAPGVSVMAFSEDGLVEAIKVDSQTFAWAVQWHPEFSYKTDEASMKIFEAFVHSMK